MTIPTTAEEALAQAALGPKRVKVGGGVEEVEAQSLKDLQAIADREAAVAAGSSPHMGLRFSTLISPGCGG